MPEMKEARLLGTPVHHAPRSGSPLKQAARLPSDGSASPTLSATSFAPSASRSASPAPSKRPQPSSAELKAAAAAAVARTRIVGDASRTSAFRREEDEELWRLFTQ